MSVHCLTAPATSIECGDLAGASSPPSADGDGGGSPSHCEATLRVYDNTLTTRGLFRASAY